MGLRINTNVPALIAQKNLRTNRSSLDQTLERMSSGHRINHAGDDAAGLAISESLRAQLRGISQAERNAQDGISMLQVAEGAIAEVSNILIRMRELSVQTSSDTVGEQERKFIDTEFQQLIAEIGRIANSTEYNKVPLLNGRASSFEIQVGTKNTPEIDRIKLFDPTQTDISPTALGINLATVADKLSSQNVLEMVDNALTSVATIRAQLGAMQNRLNSIIANIMTSKENLSAANSRIRDADLAEESTNLAKGKILMEAGVSVLGQANSSASMAMQLLSGGRG